MWVVQAKMNEVEPSLYNPDAACRNFQAGAAIVAQMSSAASTESSQKPLRAS
jgi:hypothetical protein